MKKFKTSVCENCGKAIQFERVGWSVDLSDLAANEQCRDGYFCCSACLAAWCGRVFPEFGVDIDAIHRNR